MKRVSGLILVFCVSFLAFYDVATAEQLNYDLRVNDDYEAIFLHGYDNLEVTGESDNNVDFWIAKKSDYDDWVASGHLSTVRVIGGAMCNDCRDFFFNFSMSASDSHVVVISGMYPPVSADVEVNIHASKPPEDDSPACFAADSLITLTSGVQIPIVDIVVGDEIWGVDSSGHIVKSAVVYIPHLLNSKLSNFVSITYTTSNESHTLRMTPKHLLPVCTTHDCSTCSSGQLLQAAQITDNSCIQVRQSNTTLWTRPESITLLQKHGIYSLVTNTPYLLVNGVVVSPFEINHALPHYFYSLHRFLYAFLPASLWNYRARYFTDAIGVIANFFLSL